MKARQSSKQSLPTVRDQARGSEKTFKKLLMWKFIKMLIPGLPTAKTKHNGQCPGFTVFCLFCPQIGSPHDPISFQEDVSPEAASVIKS